MAKAGKIDVEFDFSKPAEGFEALARMLAGWASSAQNLADALRALDEAEEDGVDKSTSTL
jgi:hypothetical protein